MERCPHLGCPGEREGNRRMGMPLFRLATSKRDPGKGRKYGDLTCSISIHGFLSAPIHRYRGAVEASCESVIKGHRKGNAQMAGLNLVRSKRY